MPAAQSREGTEPNPATTVTAASPDRAVGMGEAARRSVVPSASGCVAPGRASQSDTRARAPYVVYDRTCGCGSSRHLWRDWTRLVEVGTKHT